MIGDKAVILSEMLRCVIGFFFLREQSFTMLALLTTKEAADRARVHVGTLRTWIRTGDGPAVTKLGGKQLIREDALARWLEKHTTPGIAA